MTDHVSSQGLACAADAFTPEERMRWRALATRYLLEAPVRRELANGFAFEHEGAPETLGEIAEFVGYESRCCPFVELTVRVGPGGGAVVLEMTGGPGVKQLLASELGLGS
jgi:hypothetical protein